MKEHYHRPSDDLSLPRDSAPAVRFVRFMADIARRIANGDEAPRWNAGDFFGEKLGGKPGEVTQRLGAPINRSDCH